MQPMRGIRLYMPEGGEAGVIVATRVDDGVRVEFRGAPYQQWDIDENTPMYNLHACLRRINISQLHADEVETVTTWHEEWPEVEAMFLEALSHVAE